MAVTVEHDKRREKILEKALTVFMDDGFEAATFQKIADKCGITRTILYLYFKNKREIFTYSIKQLLLSAEKNLNAIRDDAAMKTTDKINKILLSIFDLLEKNRQLLSVVLDYLLHISKGDANPEERVRRRTVKLRHIFSSVIINGVKAGELKKVNLKTAYNFLYGFVEAAIFQLVVLKRKNLDDLKNAVAYAVKQFEAV
ncbi:MAG: TetR/AcrR family transcriptional regulator [Treponema sp.]|nr:TetR/AcrR family transcriptional regulator [Treponema sp.]